MTQGGRNPVIVVCGCARCGTTMMMRMLEAGGIPVVCDNRVSYEDHRAAELPKNHAWLWECAGKAVKILDPHHFSPPHGHEYWFIWMYRNPIEQAKSQVKFLRAVGVPVSSRSVKAIAESLYLDNESIPSRLVRLYPGSRLWRIGFEDVIHDPQKSARGISISLGADLNVSAMASVVDKRGPRCLPNLVELDRVPQEQG